MTNFFNDDDNGDEYCPCAQDQLLRGGGGPAREGGGETVCHRRCGAPGLCPTS